jgi:hypothetical protein
MKWEGFKTKNLSPLKCIYTMLILSQVRSIMLKTTVIVSKWGNSQALRIPAEIIRQLGIHTNDEVILEVSKAKLTVTKSSTPGEGTIEHLY